jgi:hypothetical protein
MKILCIDPGIYNLAYIFADNDNIIEWGKYSLISGSTCDNCTERSSCIITTWKSTPDNKYTPNTQNLCAKHRTAFRKKSILREIDAKSFEKIFKHATNPKTGPKNVQKQFDDYMMKSEPATFSAMNIMTTSDLRVIRPTTIADIEKYIKSTYYLLSPTTKSRDVYSVEFLHDRLWEFIARNPLFKTADLICIEN